RHPSHDRDQDGVGVVQQDIGGPPQHSDVARATAALDVPRCFERVDELPHAPRGPEPAEGLHLSDCWWDSLPCLEPNEPVQEVELFGRRPSLSPPSHGSIIYPNDPGPKRRPARSTETCRGAASSGSGTSLLILK